MPTLTRLQRINSAIMEEYKQSMLKALEDPEIIDRYRLIFEPLFKSLLEPFTRKVTDTIDSLKQSIHVLKNESQAKDKIISELQKDVADLKVQVDNHEQHSRRDSIRIFGLSEETPGTTDEKVMRLCNQRMKLTPPLKLDEISISHRVGKPRQTDDENETPLPRPLLVKFATRRSKNRVMEARKELRPKQPRGTPRPGFPPPEDHTEPDMAERDDSMADGVAVYLADDLTKMRAFLAFRARQAKRDHKIMDTWVIDTKIMIKDNHSRICQVTSIDHLLSKLD